MHVCVCACVCVWIHVPVMLQTLTETTYRKLYKIHNNEEENEHMTKNLKNVNFEQLQKQCSLNFG